MNARTWAALILAALVLVSGTASAVGGKKLKDETLQALDTEIERLAEGKDAGEPALLAVKDALSKRHAFLFAFIPRNKLNDAYIVMLEAEAAFEAGDAKAYLSMLQKLRYHLEAILTFDIPNAENVF